MICGLYVDEDGMVHICERDARSGERRERIEEGFRPFMWAAAEPVAEGMEVTRLAGAGELNRLLHFDLPKVFSSAASDRSLQGEAIRPLEAQFLMQKRERYYRDMVFNDLRRVSLDIAVENAHGSLFPDPAEAENRIQAIALVLPDGASRILTPSDSSSASERELLKAFASTLHESDPDIIEGHGILSGAMDYLYRRARRYRVKPMWGRFGAEARARKSRMRIAERWIDYVRCDVPGRSVFDSSIAAQVYDISARALPGYELDDVAEYFSVTMQPCEGAEEGEKGEFCHLLKKVHKSWALSSTLLPTYFAQSQNIPLPMQEVCLRGSSAKVDSLLFERYYHERYALPDYPEGYPFEGAYSNSFETGTFKGVLHYDVASLYPSLLLTIGRGPSGDELDAFVPLLKELRQLRLEYKKLAREADSVELRNTYDARQQSFKILINSFYGYLGFPQARFADPALAAEITRRGRELLQALIEEFQTLGCRVLEADTDGIYLEGGEYWEKPEELLQKVLHVLPEGIDLEYDGSYNAMFCYKAKNYALYNGQSVEMKGSAFRSRSVEPFLMELTRALVCYMLGAAERPPAEVVQDAASLIESGKMPIEKLAKSEYLSMSPEAYEKKIDAGGKPRRASLEVALRMDPSPRMGEKVSYYILPKEKGQTSDWQRARPLADYDPDDAPYAPEYYLKKLKDWQKRYSEFLKETDTSSQQQEELF